MKNYEVTKYTEKETINYGTLPEADVNRILRGYKYDRELGLYFSPKANIAYQLVERR